MALTSKQPFIYEQTADRQINNLQRTSANVALALNNMPWSVGIHTPATTFTGGQQVSLNHGLGRSPRGFICIDVTGGYGAFKRTAQSGDLDTKTILITSQNACTATFWIY